MKIILSYKTLCLRKLENGSTRKLELLHMRFQLLHLNINWKILNMKSIIPIWNHLGILESEYTYLCHQEGSNDISVELLQEMVPVEITDVLSFSGHAGVVDQ